MSARTRPEPDEAMSIAAFFDWLNGQPERYELVEGQPKLLPWVRRGHARIVGNISFLLQSALDRSRYDVHQGDFAIPTGKRSIRYADVFVEPSGGSNNDRTTDAAILVVEVLSDSTAAEDFGPKRAEYLGLPTLDTYLIAAQDRRCLWQWTRDGDGLWPKDPLVVTAGSVALTVLGVTLPLDAIYRGVVPDPASASDA